MFSNKLLPCLSAICVLVFSSSAFACACCVERGYYSVVNARPDSFYISILNDMKFAAPAEFYMTVAGFDATKGLAELEKDEAAGRSIALDVVESFSNKAWSFKVKTGSGRAGTLRLPMPPTMRRFMVDVDGVDNGLGVSLYKEFSVTGKVGGATGIFRSAARNTKYTLLFQGHGNGCDDASNFYRWRLELEGPRAEYAFFGDMK